GEFLDQFSLLVEDAWDIGQEKQARSTQCASNSTCKRVGIDVVSIAIAAGRDGCDDRNHLRFGEQVEKRTIDFHDIADEAEVEYALNIRIGIDDRLLCLFGEHHIAVLATKADRPF